MKRVLVTGATGFIGRHCPALLQERGYAVHAVSRQSKSSESEAGSGSPIEWHRADLLVPGTPAALVSELRPTHLLHIAWIADHGRFWEATENDEWLRASAELVAAFAASRDALRAVSVGSCAEYDWSDGVPGDRPVPCRPATRYGQSKHAAQEQQTRWLGEAGLGSAWGRVFFPYGPGEPATKLVASTIRSLLRGEEAPSTAGEQVRDYVYVVDVASALVELLDGSVEGPVDIGSGVPRRVREVIETIGRLLGREDLLRIGALPQREDEPDRLVADASRLRDEVGWRPAYALEAGLAETIDFWRSRVDLEPRGACHP